MLLGCQLSSLPRRELSCSRNIIQLNVFTFHIKIKHRLYFSEKIIAHILLHRKESKKDSLLPSSCNGPSVITN